MSEFSARLFTDPHPYNDFLLAHYGHLLQSFEWGEFKTRFGWHALRLGIESNHTLAAAQMLIRRAPFFTFAYVPRGPTFAPLATTESDATRALITALVTAARQHNAMILKLEPDLDTVPAWANELAASGFAPSSDTIQPRTTIHLDLTPSLDTILAAMKPKWRYNIRLAEKKGVVIRELRADEFPRVYELMRVTGVRDRFAVHSLEYYQQVTAQLADHARWFIATYENEIIAAIFVTAFGDEAIYLYGASGNAHRDKMPNHALHWAAIQWAKERGCQHYDWWGIPDKVSDDDDKLPEGLYRFKQGFGGEVIRYIGAYDLVLRPMWYRLYKQLARFKSNQ